MTGRPDQKVLLHGYVFPGPALRGFISHFWFTRWNTGVQDHLSYHSTASTNTEIVFAFSGDNGRSTPVFSSAQGHTESYRLISTGGFSDMFGVSIYSHAMPFFFDVSAGEFANQMVDLDEIAKPGFTQLTDLLAAHCDFTRRVEIMTAYLMRRFTVLYDILYSKEDPALAESILPRYTQIGEELQGLDKAKFLLVRADIQKQLNRKIEDDALKSLIRKHEGDNEDWRRIREKHGEILKQGE